MAITSIGSHLTTANAIDAHWTDVDAERTGGGFIPLLLPGDYSIADFQAERDALQAAITAQEDLDNAVQLAIGDRDSQKENLRERMRQFRSAGKLYFPETAYLRAMPTMPRFSTNESRFLKPLDDMASLWARVNAETTIPGFTPPLLLAGGYSVTGFTTDVAALRASYRQVTTADHDLDLARRRRDLQLGSIRERIVKYRTVIELEYGPGHPFYDSLPGITPAPGTTPDAVTASGMWDSVTNEAAISWVESTNPNLDHYSIRMTPGTTFDSENNSILGAVLAGETEFRTTAGLQTIGATASFRVYVVLTTGNEAGSNTVTITRT